MFDVEQVKQLNDLERIVYEYIVKHPDKVKYMRIRELSSETHVSTSTILRFCKKMGCNGYSEFKLQFREHINRKNQFPMRDDISEVVDFLKKSSSNEFESKLNMLADVIFQADNVFLVGSGMSGIVAKYGARYFSSMGKFCLYIDEPHYPTESCFIDNSFVIVFSVSGESRDTIDHVTQIQREKLPHFKHYQYGKLHHCQTVRLQHCLLCQLHETQRLRCNNSNPCHQHCRTSRKKTLSIYCKPPFFLLRQQNKKNTMLPLKNK